jgi:hypothetical protein
LKEEHNDRKIWMARDPRDVAVSRMLYRWQRGNKGQKRQYLAHLNLVFKKSTTLARSLLQKFTAMPDPINGRSF